MTTPWFRVVIALLLAGCDANGSNEEDAGSDAALPAMPWTAPTAPLPLGGGTHDLAAVAVTVLATSNDGLKTPRDLEFDPQQRGHLWVVNHDSSFVVLLQVGTEAQSARKLDGYGNGHFLAKPSALAFGAPGTLATAQEEDELTEQSSSAMYMGPTLWTTDLRINEGGNFGHIDMLHDTQNGAGIAWDHDNVYWVVDGARRGITRYDFRADHGPGRNDHSDGIIARYIEGELGYIEGIGAHAVVDRATHRLFVADPGNRRVVVLDTRSGTRGADITPNQDGGELYRMEGATLTTFLDSSVGLQRPSGIALYGRWLIVGDNATSRLWAFDATSGAVVDYLDLAPTLPPPGLAGIATTPEGALVVADSVGDRVLRIANR